jgi:hypothetical protein
MSPLVQPSKRLLQRLRRLESTPCRNRQPPALDLFAGEVGRGDVLKRRERLIQRPPHHLLRGLGSWMNGEVAVEVLRRVTKDGKVEEATKNRKPPACPCVIR